MKLSVQFCKPSDIIQLKKRKKSLECGKKYHVITLGIDFNKEIKAKNLRRESLLISCSFCGE